MSAEDERLLMEAKWLPWDERLRHKSWKVRRDANVDLAALCDSIADPKDARLREFGPLFQNSVADCNVSVREKALDAVLAFQRASDAADASRYAKGICDAIVAKCLTGRPRIVEKAQAALLLWVGLDAAEVFVESMEKAVKNKMAKAVVPAIDVMFQALSKFGPKVVPPKKVLKMLPQLLDHPDRNVRASSKGLTVELCWWIGKEPVKAILFEKIRDMMIKELEAELANNSAIAKPAHKIRFIRCYDCTWTLIDEYDLVDPVHTLTPPEESGFCDGVKATKWSERRDATELTKLSSTKRIATGDFEDICPTPKKNDGCDFSKWYEPKTTPTPYLKQDLLNDLYAVVHGLKEDNTEIKASLISARAQIDELMTAHNAVTDRRRKLKEKDCSACKLSARVVELEEEIQFLLSIIVGFVVLIVALCLGG
ncbi:hypothetical protein OsI_04205 [Oryza sativa Indica Group]|uniref:TOG domain-containing protein n=1 Tax=Oryza sativa subsp. indica TaxID=39946 RepID=A2WWC3_ORYSI|nr:hypothetical protein OsI_04205 [Oryza sativa Indica Group]